MRTQVLAACMATVFATPGAFAATTITEGSTIEGRWEKGDREKEGYWVDSYSYVGEAGEELWIPWNSRSTSARMEVRGPRGFSATEPPGIDARALRLPVAGKYVISMINDVPSGEYKFAVYRATLTPMPAALTAGKVVKGSFATTDAKSFPFWRQDEFAYTARAGESAWILLEGQQSEVALELTGPDSAKRLGYSQSSLGTSAALAFTFPSDGVYRLVASGYGGNYSLGISPRMAASVAPAIPLRVGEAVQLTYSAESPIAAQGGFAQVFAVEAKRGERLAIVRPAELYQGGNIVRGPDGSVIPVEITSDDPGQAYVEGEPRLTIMEFSAPVTGVYRIEALVWPWISAKDGSLRVMPAEQAAPLMAQARTLANASAAARREKAAALLRRGEQLMNSGDNQAAVAAFLDAATLDRASVVSAHFGAGLAYFRQGADAYRWAASEFDTVLIYDPRNQAAAANAAAAREAHAAYQRDQQAARDVWNAQRRQENAQLFSNMLNAFAAGVDLGNQINVANAPPQPLPSAPAPLQPLAAAPGRAAPSTGTTQIADPANIRYGCVARSVVTVKERNLDQLVNNCNEPLSVGYFYASGGFGSMQIHDRTPKYLDSGQYTRLTICVQGTLKYDGPNIWCGPKPMDIRTR